MKIFFSIFFLIIINIFGKTSSQIFNSIDDFTDPIPKPYTLPKKPMDNLFRGSNVIYQELYGDNWKNISITSSIINDHGNFLEDVYYFWSNTSNSWILADEIKYFFLYDLNSNIITYNKLINNYISESSKKILATNVLYNSLNTINQIYYTDSVYSPSMNTWFSKTGVEEFIYYDSKLSERITTITSMDGFPITLTSGKILYTYEGNNVVEVLTQKLLDTALVNIMRFTYTYSGNKMSSIQKDNFNVNFNNWEEEYKVEYTYNEFDNIIEENYNNSSYVIFYTYDENNNMIESIEIGDEINRKIVISYDLNNLPIIANAYNWENNNYSSTSKERWIWNAFLNLNFNPVLFKNQTQPNPFEKEFTVNWNSDATYMIYSLNGNIVKEGIISIGSNTISLSTVQSGSYFLKIVSKDGVSTSILNKQ
ncbi:MAG: T9SS type A sorting domain-containing protein [Flavobacteriia bacterium]|nr:T9SS type A sorting domain-containing protein [Flavobacteriia bacterium]